MNKDIIKIFFGQCLKNEALTGQNSFLKSCFDKFNYKVSKPFLVVLDNGILDIKYQYSNDIEKRLFDKDDILFSYYDFKEWFKIVEPLVVAKVDAGYSLSDACAELFIFFNELNLKKIENIY